MVKERPSSFKCVADARSLYYEPRLQTRHASSFKHSLEDAELMAFTPHFEL